MGRRRTPGAAFSLIELLVVVAVIAICFGLIAFLPRSDKRRADVKAAAEELASTLRLARSLALERKAIIAVSFNIQNGAGTSGRVINNWDGGHWYRILGTCQNESYGTFGKSNIGLPTYARYSGGPSYKTARFLRDVSSTWIGDPHTLQKRKVRFLALGDQDNGGAVCASKGTRFGDTYPRPWFGYWVSSASRLYPWGGYDPAVTNSGGQPGSGFFYQGGGPAVVGSQNPADVNEGTVTILKQGAVRPLVNGDWLDYVLAFRPDGTVAEGEPFQGRKAAKVNGETAIARMIDPVIDGYWSPLPESGMITSYASHTGAWSITLCPDVAKDTDTFGSLQEAWDSLSPAYRVTIDREGQVRVVPVRYTEPTGTTYDTTMAAADYQNGTRLNRYYRHNVATNPDGSPRGMPVTDFLTPDLLARRNWWLQVPP